NFDRTWTVRLGCVQSAELLHGLLEHSGVDYRIAAIHCLGLMARRRSRYVGGALKARASSVASSNSRRRALKSRRNGGARPVSAFSQRTTSAGQVSPKYRSSSAAKRSCLFSNSPIHKQYSARIRVMDLRRPPSERD